MMFLDCPAYLGEEGTVRCRLSAEVQTRYTVRSTDGPLESAKVWRLRGHWFNGPIESLTVAQPRTVAVVSASSLPPLMCRGAGPGPAEPRTRLPAGPREH